MAKSDDRVLFLGIQGTSFIKMTEVLASALSSGIQFAQGDQACVAAMTACAGVEFICGAVQEAGMPGDDGTRQLLESLELMVAHAMLLMTQLVPEGMLDIKQRLAAQLEKVRTTRALLGGSSVIN